MTDITVESGKVMTVTEDMLSRSGSTIGAGSERYEFSVFGSTAQVDVIEAIKLVAPTVSPRGYAFEGISDYRPVYIDGVVSLWKCVVQYSSLVGLSTGTRTVAVGSSRLRLSSTTEDTLVTIQKEVLSRNVPEGKTAVPYEGIGDNGETFDGINVPEARFEFAYDFHIPGSTVTLEYMALCAEAVGKKNSNTFKGFPKGEVFCSKVDGTFATNADSQLTFIFKWRKSAPEIKDDRMFIDEVAEVSIPAHSNWDVLDVHTKTVVDPDTKFIQVKMTQVDILRVFDEFDFNLMQIPGGNIIKW